MAARSGYIGTCDMTTLMMILAVMRHQRLIALKGLRNLEDLNNPSVRAHRV